MLYITVDARDGGVSSGGGSCDTCCCENITLRPGETNSVVINYAPWSLPVAPPGIIPTMEYSVEHSESGCPTGAIDGFAPVTTTNYLLATPVSTALGLDLSVSVAPALNVFSYSIMPMSGPTNGSLAQVGASGDPTFTYTPNPGYQGYDYFSYKVTDAQGRTVIRHVQVSVGVHTQTPNASLLATGPFIDPARITTNQAQQTVSFPIYLPISVRDCDEYRLTIKQPANDCDRNLYTHISCYDIRSSDCG